MTTTHESSTQIVAPSLRSMRYCIAYGSPDFSVENPKKQGRDAVEIKSAKLSSDARKVTLEIPGLKPVMQMLIDLLNNRITPVVQSRGTLGEADLAQIENLEATMVGKGDCYYRGVRMPAAQALK